MEIVECNDSDIDHHVVVAYDEKESITVVHSLDLSLIIKSETIGTKYQRSQIVCSRFGTLLFLLSNSSIIWMHLWRNKYRPRYSYVSSNIPMPERPSPSLLKSLFSGGKGSSFDYSKLSDQPTKKGSEKGKEQSQTIASTKDVMSSNVVALEERGKKLQNLNDKTEDLSLAASDFYQMAKALSKTQEKKWYEL